MLHDPYMKLIVFADIELQVIVDYYVRKSEVTTYIIVDTHGRNRASTSLIH